jgi:hypothetical protein
MIRIGKAVASTLSVVALAMGASVTASAQTTQPSETQKGTTEQPSETGHPQAHPKEGTKGVTAPQGAAASPKESAQEHLDREKTALKNRVHEQLAAADANIAALKKLGDTEKGTTKKRDDEMQKKLSDMRDHLQKDVDKIDKSTTTDWSDVRPAVQRDLGAMEAELRTAEAVTKVPSPRTGAANKQPSGPEPSHPTPAPAPVEKSPAPVEKQPAPQP